MRKCLALLCALALLASPFFFAYFEAERLLGWPEAAYQWFDPWLWGAVMVAIALIPIALPWIVDLFGAETGRRDE